MTGVLVTGGTGKTGSVLAELLRGGGVPVRVAGRKPPAGDPGAVRFDWDDPATHPAALRGMDRVYLVPPPLTVDPMPQVGPFLDEAERLGVRRVVLLGSAVVLPDAPGALELAARVRARPGWVVLRPSGFMQNFLSPHPVGDGIRRHGEIRTAAGAGRLGWIDARDIAAAAAALLAGPDGHPHDRRDYLLTGPKALSYGEAAAIITAETGRPVRVEPIEPAEVAAGHRAAGLPAALADALAAVDAGLAAGLQDQVSTDVLDLTGRPPRSFAAFVRDHATAWTPGA
ncbi:oxidoreductase [Nonomuraea candida]|uniref:oxidoreductase n=1 Tax=Nonomuraea candida TaxID=359159 RepID=UPI0005BE59A9|nr:oxidoreductase [Nonomuraea candida]